MAIGGFDELLRALRDHPEWREDLRRLVLSEALLVLPETVASLADAQRATADGLDSLTAQVGALAGQVEALTSQMGSLAGQMQALTARVDALTARVDALAQQMEALTARVDALTQQMQALTEQVSTLSEHVAWLKGDAIERRYRERASAYFGRIATRLHVLPPEELDALLEEAVTAGALSSAEADEVRWADAVIRGRWEDGSEVYLVVEASWGIGIEDARRARERAELLARTGRTALGVVAGAWISPDAAETARGLRLWQVADGGLLDTGELVHA
jgi:uncharacterized protein YoxC